MKNKLRIILLIIGIMLLIYPIISNALYKITQTIAITNYQVEIIKKNKEEIEEIKEEYEQYNKDIYENATSNINLLNTGEILGYIKIKKLNINLQIYEGTSNDVLETGIGHLENTSMPGTVNSHCVLAGHTGLSKATLFDNIDKLVIGDNFEITILDNNYQYEVDQIKIVEKNNTDDLKIINGKEMVTLVTCTPKFINTKRLLVRGKRIYDEKVEVVEAINSSSNNENKPITTTVTNKEVVFIDINSILIVLIIILFIKIFFSTLKKIKKDAIFDKK